MLPNLSCMHISGVVDNPTTDGTGPPPGHAERAQLAVTESPFMPGCGFIHLATVSVAEMAVAEYCCHVLKTLPHLSAKRQKVDDGESSQGPPREIQTTINSICSIGNEIHDRPVPYGMSEDAAQSLDAWKKISVMADMLRRPWSDDNHTTCNEFLKAYLKARGLPTDTPFDDLNSSSRHNRYGEYLTRCSFGFYHSREFTKTLRVHAEGAPSSACVGVIMLNDVPRKYNWSSLLGREREELQWRIEGVVACPFYLQHQKGGIGRAILHHLEHRLTTASGVNKIVVGVAHDAPSKWKEKLRKTPFINCAGWCDASDDDDDDE